MSSLNIGPIGAGSRRDEVERELVVADDSQRRALVKQREAERRCHQAAEVFRRHHALLRRRVRDFAGRPFNAAGYADQITGNLYNHLHGVCTIHRLIDRIVRTGDRLAGTTSGGPRHARWTRIAVADTPENRDGHHLIDVVIELQGTVANFDPRV